jgi:hypothetical protein
MRSRFSRRVRIDLAADLVRVVAHELEEDELDAAWLTSEAGAHLFPPLGGGVGGVEDAASTATYI